MIVMELNSVDGSPHPAFYQQILTPGHWTFALF